MSPSKPTLVQVNVLTGSGTEHLALLLLVVLFGKVMKPSGGGALLEDVRQWGWVGQFIASPHSLLSL